MTRPRVPHANKRKAVEQARLAERSKKALDLALRGWDYEAIAKDLGCSRATAYRVVRRAIDKIPEENAQRAKKRALRRIEREFRRSDEVLAKLDRALSRARLADLVNGTLVGAIARMQLVRVRLEQRRAALQGLDAPKPPPMVQVNITPERERPNLAALPPADLKTMRALLAKAQLATDENAITVQAEDDHGDQVERGGSE